MNSLTCLLELKTDSFTGRPTFARVCANCEVKRNETTFLRAYLKQMNRGEEIPVSHGICPACFQAELDRLKLS